MSFATAKPAQPAPTEPAAGERLHEGWLSLGDNSYYFALYQDRLDRFGTEEDASAGRNGSKIFLDSVDNVDVIGDTSFEFEFQDGTKWELKAESPEDTDTWLDALEPLFTEEEDPAQPGSTGADSTVPTVEASNEAGGLGKPSAADGGAAPAPTTAEESAAGAEEADEEGEELEEDEELDEADEVDEAEEVEEAEEAEEAQGPGAASLGTALPEPAPSSAAPTSAASAAPVPKASSPTAAAAPPAAAKSSPSRAAKSLVRPADAPVDVFTRASLAQLSKTAPAAAEPAQKVAVQKPTVKVVVVGVTGPLFSKKAAKGRWVTCEVPSKPNQIFRTPSKVDKHPTWNCELFIRNYQSNDLLHFSVISNHQIIAYCDLPTEAFHPTPFEDDLDLFNEKDAKLKNCKLRVKVYGKALDKMPTAVRNQRGGSRRQEAPALEAEDDEEAPDGDSGAGKAKKDLEVPTAEMHMSSSRPRGPRGAVRIVGTVYDQKTNAMDDDEVSKTPVSSVVDDKSDAELNEDEERLKAHETFSSERYRGKYHHLSHKLRFEGDGKEMEKDMLERGAGFYKQLNPKLNWAVDGKAVKEWESTSFIHKQMTLHGLIAQTSNVLVNVVRMRGMRSNGWKLRWDGECRCHVRNPTGQVSTRFSTGVKEDLTAPSLSTPWNHESEVVLDSNQDSLEFTINGICKDSWPRKYAVLGRARLPSSKFLARGFSGEIRIEGRETVEAYLHVVVAVLRIWDEEMNMEILPHEAAEILKRAAKADNKIMAPDGAMAAKAVKEAKRVKITAHDMLHFDAIRRNLDQELQRKMIHQTMTTPFRSKRWMWDEVDNVLMREVYSGGPVHVIPQPMATGKETIAVALGRDPSPRLEFSTAHVFEEGDAELAFTGPALDKDKHYLCLNEDYEPSDSSETFDNNAVETSSESAAEEVEQVASLENASRSMSTRVSRLAEQVVSAVQEAASKVDEDEDGEEEEAEMQEEEEEAVDGEAEDLEEREQAAIAIQAKVRQRKAKKEVEKRRQDKEDMEEQEDAAIAIQARVRQRKAKKEVAKQRQEKESKDKENESKKKQLEKEKLPSRWGSDDDGTKSMPAKKRPFLSMGRKSEQSHTERSRKSLQGAASWSPSAMMKGGGSPKKVGMFSRISGVMRRTVSGSKAPVEGESRASDEDAEGSKSDGGRLSSVEGSEKEKESAEEDAAGDATRSQAISGKKIRHTVLDEEAEVVEIPGREDEDGDEDQDELQQDEFDEEDLEEREDAAIFIQAKVRQRQAKKEVDKMREAKEKKTTGEEEEIVEPDEFDEEDLEEREQAAIAIQSKVRQRKAKKEVDQRRQAGTDRKSRRSKKVLEPSAQHGKGPPPSPLSNQSREIAPEPMSPWQRARLGVRAGQALTQGAKAPSGLRPSVRNVQSRIDTGLRKPAANMSRLSVGSAMPKRRTPVDADEAKDKKGKKERRRERSKSPRPQDDDEDEERKEKKDRRKGRSKSPRPQEDEEYEEDEGRRNKKEKKEKKERSPRDNERKEKKESKDTSRSPRSQEEDEEDGDRRRKKDKKERSPRDKDRKAKKESPRAQDEEEVEEDEHKAKKEKKQRSPRDKERKIKKESPRSQEDEEDYEVAERKAKKENKERSPRDKDRKAKKESPRAQEESEDGEDEVRNEKKERKQKSPRDKERKEKKERRDQSKSPPPQDDEDEEDEEGKEKKERKERSPRDKERKEKKERKERS